LHGNRPGAAGLNTEKMTMNTFKTTWKIAQKHAWDNGYRFTCHYFGTTVIPSHRVVWDDTELEGNENSFRKLWTLDKKYEFIQIDGA
jgi:hypothetical protein